ncbi:Cyanovirin-N [Colletotrichum navitas]|uniref:Cyanovirin-N n=1 Tax=Colletotrichum navitas TaxID=681940 RepID=A0AAD8PKE5_9PEZI|nr:Cyanovirin-N [Colletotrichum navitas]KAK1566082.1 Cyanovirin-N [Colletotrichum navitas]
MQISAITSIILGIVSVQVSAAGFRATCDTVNLSGFTLSAECTTGLGGFPRATTLDINKCFFAVDGKINCGAGGISGCKCSQTDVAAASCTCPDNAGKQVTNNVNLDACISNSDGKLSC